MTTIASSNIVFFLFVVVSMVGHKVILLFFFFSSPSYPSVSTLCFACYLFLLFLFSWCCTHFFFAFTGKTSSPQASTFVKRKISSRHVFARIRFLRRRKKKTFADGYDCNKFFIYSSVFSINFISEVKFLTGFFFYYYG
jgi:hypothetical protein